jgi:hypothetical protein
MAPPRPELGEKDRVSHAMILIAIRSRDQSRVRRFGVLAQIAGLIFATTLAPIKYTNA